MKKILVDIIPVVVGILLALFINNWRQASSESAYIRNSVLSIIKENRGNINELDYAIKRQKTFLDTLKNYINDDQFTLAEVLVKTKGVTTPDLKSTTWKFLLEDSKHTLVPYEFISRLTEIEKYKASVDRNNNKVSDIIYQPSFFDDLRLKKVAMVFFSDFIATESNLKQQLIQFNAFAMENFQIDEREISSMEGVIE